MATFKAIVIEKGEARAGNGLPGLADFDEANLWRRRHRPGRMVDAQLQGRSCNRRQGADRTSLSEIPGIDFAGTVETTSHPEWKPGDKVILNGWGCGETDLGAYGERARVRGNWLVRFPAGMTTREAMAIETAGYTAMLAVMALERHGLTPMSGPVVVTGAAGGVGSVAITILA